MSKLRPGGISAQRPKLNIAESLKTPGNREGEDDLRDSPVSLKYWKPFFWDAVQHFLHPTNAILHHHIRERPVKKIFFSETDAEFQTDDDNLHKDIFSASLRCRGRQPTESRSCVGVFLAAEFPCEHREKNSAFQKRQFSSRSRGVVTHDSRAGA